MIKKPDVQNVQGMDAFIIGASPAPVTGSSASPGAGVQAPQKATAAVEVPKPEKDKPEPKARAGKTDLVERQKLFLMHLPVSIHRGAKGLAEEDGTTLHQIILDAITKELKNRDR